MWPIQSLENMKNFYKGIEFGGAFEYDIKIDGVPIIQNKYICDIYPQLLANNNIEIIIEIGSAYGSFPIFLRKYCNYDKTLITYDVKDNRPETIKKDFQRLDIDFRKKNVFKVENEIASLIKSEKQVLLFCDGGNKKQEINTFVKYLKPRDIIIGHDYSFDLKYFNEHLKEKYWEVCELVYADISKTCELYNIKQIMKGTSQEGVSFIGQKND